MTDWQQQPPLRRDLGGVAVVKGPGATFKGDTLVHVGPEPGVCQVDAEYGCGYCLGVPCRNPNPPAATP